MKGPTLALFLLLVLLAVVEVRSRQTVKLCGLDYVRTVIYICASSQWRRHLEGHFHSQQGIEFMHLTYFSRTPFLTTPPQPQFS